MVKQNKSRSQSKTDQHATIRKGGGLIKKDKSTASHDGYQILKKKELVRIEISKLPKQKPDFDLPGATKDGLIADWLIQFVSDGLKNNSLTDSHLLPKKADLAKYLGVSIGTVQNAIRFIEDKGYVESKQRIGTIISDPEQANQRIRKLTSKRDQAVIAIKKVVLDRNIEPGEALPSARELARVIGSAPNTTRLALEFLSSIGTVENRGARGNKANWFLNEIPKLSEQETVNAIESETLIDQIERDLKQLISTEFQVGDKLPSHLELADLLKVSIKTVHDAMNRVIQQGIVHSKRGRYGTFVVRMPDTDKLLPTEEAAAIFIPAQEAAFYNYEKVESHLKGIIAKNYKVGDKLPSMSQLAQELDVSSNTIRKALQNLGQQDIVRFERGRYGGTFVTVVPNVEEEKSFTWVSINPETIKSYRQQKGSSKEKSTQ